MKDLYESLHEAHELDEASSDFIKIGNKVYPKDMSTYDADATEKEIADKAKRQYEQDKQAEAEAKRKARWQNSRDFFEQHGEDVALVRDTMQELIRRRFHGMPAVHLDNLLNYVMRCSTRTLTKMHYHLSSEYNQHTDRMLELVKGIDDRYVAYRGSEELVAGKPYSIGYLDSTFIYIGADANYAYFFQDYQSVFATIDHSLSINRYISGSDEGISVVDKSEAEELNLSFEEIFREYVPHSGNSDVLGGELVRAWNRVLYRYFNDGDMLSDEEPYGGILPGAHFVQGNVSDGNIVDMIQRMYSAEDREYADLLHKVKDALADYINKNPQLLKVQNKKDYLKESSTDSDDTNCADKSIKRRPRTLKESYVAHTKDLRQRVSNTIEARWAENARVTQLLKDKLSQSLDNVSMVGNKLKTIKITIPAKHYYYSVSHISPHKNTETDEYLLFDDKEEIMSCTDDSYVDKFSNYILSKINEELEMNSIYEQMNKIDDSKSLNKKWNVKNQLELKKLQENLKKDADLKKIVKLVKQYICSTYSCADLQIDTKDSTMFVEIWTEDSEYDDYDYDDIYSDSPDFTARLDIEKLIKLKDNIDEFETYVEDSISGYTVDSTEEDFYDRAAEELESYFNCSGAFLEPSTQLGRGRTFLFADDMKFEGSFDFQAGESYIKSNNFEGFLELCKDSFTVVTEESLTEAAKITTKSMLNEKYNVKNQRELKKLKENFTVRQYSLNWDGEYEWEDEESFNTVDEAQIRFNELKEVIDNGEFDYAAIALVDENDNEISIYGEPERQKVTKEDVIEYLRDVEEVSLTDREFDYVVEDLWDAISSEMREGSIYKTIDDVNMVELIDASDNPTHDLCYKLMGLVDDAENISLNENASVDRLYSATDLIDGEYEEIPSYPTVPRSTWDGKWVLAYHNGNNWIFYTRGLNFGSDISRAARFASRSDALRDRAEVNKRYKRLTDYRANFIAVKSNSKQLQED